MIHILGGNVYIYAKPFGYQAVHILTVIWRTGIDVGKHQGERKEENKRSDLHEMTFLQQQDNGFAPVKVWQALHIGKSLSVFCRADQIYRTFTVTERVWPWAMLKLKLENLGLLKPVW